MALSTIVSFCYGEADLFALLVPTCLAGVCGGFLFLSNRKNKGSLTRKDCYIIISGAWVVFSLFGMLPFMIYGTTDTVADAFFETMSGFTTTGASVLNNIEEQPHGILFWRSVQQWMGGLGIMLFSIALLPSYNRNNTQLFSTEATSVAMRKLRPKTQETARGIFLIYAILTAVCVLFYFIGPMSFYDAVCHAMTTVGTGGLPCQRGVSLVWYFHIGACLYLLYFAGGKPMPRVDGADAFLL